MADPQGCLEVLPRLAAQHMLDGFPLELLDGDAGLVNCTWIQAVLYALEMRLSSIAVRIHYLACTAHTLAQSHAVHRAEACISAAVQAGTAYPRLRTEGHAIDDLMWQGPARVRVVSVLGLQSSGKSTLLNTMFSCSLPTAAGKVTEGVSMQLVPCKQPSSCDYLLLLDTEGLQCAPVSCMCQPPA